MMEKKLPTLAMNKKPNQVDHCLFWDSDNLQIINSEETM